MVSNWEILLPLLLSTGSKGIWYHCLASPAFIFMVGLIFYCMAIHFVYSVICWWTVGCFYFAKNIYLQVFFLGWMFLTGVNYWVIMFTYWGTMQTIFQGGFTILYSHEQGRSVSILPYLWKFAHYPRRVALCFTHD